MLCFPPKIPSGIIFDAFNRRSVNTDAGIYTNILTRENSPADLIAGDGLLKLISTSFMLSLPSDLTAAYAIFPRKIAFKVW